MKIKEILKGNAHKLMNLRMPVKETDAINAILEVVHDLQVCCEHLEKAADKDSDIAEDP